MLLPRLLRVHVKLRLQNNLLVKARPQLSLSCFQNYSQNHGAQTHQDLDFAVPSDDVLSDSSFGSIATATTSLNGSLINIKFSDATFSFHSQWLHDAQTDDGPYKQAPDTYTHKRSFAETAYAEVLGHGTDMRLEVCWKDGKVARFPAMWLRVYAPLVAKHHGHSTNPERLEVPTGWQVNSLEMPKVSYNDLFPAISDSVVLQIYEALLHDSCPGILKITNVPPPVVEDERRGERTLLAQVLKQIFGQVFSHPRRGTEVAYTMASHHEQYANKGQLLANYNLDRLLLPHFDQSIYQNPSLVDGLYNIEGESLNTFVSCPGVLRSLREESPELVQPLIDTPMAFGRVAHMYTPPQYQGSTPTVVTVRPGFPQSIYRFRWNPHQVGSLLCPFDEYPTALDAHRKFQEISSRDTHQLKVVFKPGDMYLWNNHTVLHGREKVLKTPRTAVGQTAPEQAVIDRWREMLIKRLLGILEERWLVQMPLAQLYELDKMVFER